MELDSMQIEQEPTPPSWDDLRAEGLVVVEDKFLKVAVYLGAEGAVVVKSQNFEELQANHFFLEHRDAQRLIDALTKAQAEAAIIAAEWDEPLASAQPEGAMQ